MTSTLQPISSDISELYLLSDIHSNAPALQAVLSVIPDDALVLCAGDIVDYYMNPNEVCELLRARGVVCIQGNHDEYVLSGREMAAEKDAKYRTEWTRNELSSENVDWLNKLPHSVEFTWENPDVPSEHLAIKLVHGSIFSNEDRLYPDTDLVPFRDGHSDIIIGGHTHHPMARECEQTLFVNPGSVGQPRDRIPGAAYARLSLRDKSVQFERRMYDLTHYIQLLNDSGFPSETVAMLSRT